MLAIRLSCERMSRGRWPGRAILPSWACGRCRRATRCSSFGRRIPRSRYWPLCPRPFRPFRASWGSCRMPAPSSSSCAARSCRSRRCRSCEARRRSAPVRICDCRRRGCPRRTAPASRGLFASMIWGGSGRHDIRPCRRPASRMPS